MHGLHGHVLGLAGYNLPRAPDFFTSGCIQKFKVKHRRSSIGFNGKLPYSIKLASRFGLRCSSQAGSTCSGELQLPASSFQLPAYEYSLQLNVK